jgi:hypothetical protein
MGFRTVITLPAMLVALLGTGAAVAQGSTHPGEHEFYFVRGIYTSPVDGDDWGPRWAIDYPEADQHFLAALKRLSAVDAHGTESAIPLGSNRIREFPFVYLAEAGAMRLSEAEGEALRAYLLGGGFLMVDDFWGTWAWDALTAELARVLPDHAIRDVPMEHPVFHAFYDIDELVQVPNVAQAATGRTHEYDGYVPRARGIFDGDGRLMVLINWNTDLGDAWEWADDADYPLHFSNYAYRLGVNIVIYAMSY